MTVTLELDPEVEAGLVALARAKGVPLDAYLGSLLEQLAAPTTSERCDDPRAKGRRVRAMGRELPAGAGAFR